jgi:beta-lactamase class A
MNCRLLFFAFILVGMFSCTTKPSLTDLKKGIITELEKTKHKYAVAFKDLESGEELLINEHELFHAASTMKTPVMIEAYKQAAVGKFSLKDSILIKNEFKSIVDSSTYSLTAKDDSDTTIYQDVGKKRTVSSLIYDMITISSNLATNILIEKVNAKAVMQTLHDMNALDIKVLRGVEDGKAYRAKLNNQVTAYDLMLIFEKLGKSEAVNKAASEEMIAVLLKQAHNTIVPAGLPKDIKVAHKTGWIKNLNHDSALVILPDGKKYVLILLSSEEEDEKASIDAMVNVSRMIYDYVNN